MKFKRILLSIFTICMISSCSPKVEPDPVDPTPTHTHDFSAKKYDDTNHWNECACGEKDKVKKHNYNEEVLEVATSKKDGKTKFTCKNCEYSYIDEHVKPTEQQLMNEEAEEMKATLETIDHGNKELAATLLNKYFDDFNDEAKAIVDNIQIARDILATDATREVLRLFRSITTIQESESQITACVNAFNQLSEIEKRAIEESEGIKQLKNVSNEYKSMNLSDLETIQRAVVNTGLAYYYQGNQIQYNQLSNLKNSSMRPEDGTADGIKYLDCSSFGNAVYWDLFGQTINGKDYPSSVATANIISYASDHFEKGGNPDYPDVILYDSAAKLADSGSNLTGETYDIERDDTYGGMGVADNQNCDEYAAEMRKIMEPGDIYVYRHYHVDKHTLSGHCMLYIGKLSDGNDYFLHSTGADNTGGPSDNYEEMASEVEATKGTIALDKAEIVFEEEHAFDTTGSYSNRYLFMPGQVSWCVLRPAKRMIKKGYAINETKAKARLLFPGLTSEKSASCGNFHSVKKGDEITYSFDVFNYANGTNLDYGVMPYAYIEDEIPAGTEFVRAPEGAVVNGNKISMQIAGVELGKKKTISYTVKVTGNVGTKIKSFHTKVNGITINMIENAVRADLDINLVLEKLEAKVGQSYTNMTTALVEAYEEAYGINLKTSGILAYSDSGTYKIGDQSVITNAFPTGVKKITDNCLFRDIVPDMLWGGRSLRSNDSNQLRDENQNLRHMETSYLEPGDYVATGNNASNKWTYKGFVYMSPTEVLCINSGKLAKLDLKQKDVDGNPVAPETNVNFWAHSLPWYSKFVVVRPSICSLYEAK